MTTDGLTQPAAALVAGTIAVQAATSSSPSRIGAVATPGAMGDTRVQTTNIWITAQAKFSQSITVTAQSEAEDATSNSCHWSSGAVPVKG